ncbi:MAG: thioesterase [Sinobacteraceae bacterium]|nr:thioesterase [Pseudomonadales bacterium]MCP5327337.1 thioesterase [Nevskiaceae bacterium]MCP5470741.1 thioesterase [Nevskiaceae bacterium]
MARVVCFPHAGASAAVYRPWALQMNPRIEVLAVQLPGRGDRLREKPLEKIADLVEHILPDVSTLVDRPLALFGHSMGSTLAFEIAAALADTMPGCPSRVIVSARRPADVPDPRPPIGHLPDSEFLIELEKRYGPIPSEVRNEPEVLALFLPVLKADIRALEHHQLNAGSGRIDCPIHAWGGREDPTTPVAHLEAWGRRTRTGHSVKLFDGGHFYLDPARATVLREMEALILGGRLDGVQAG